jgi:hypothetical protein
VIVFVAVNPLLYGNTGDRIVGLIQHRQDEMQFQRTVFNTQAVPDDLESRVRRVAQRAFDTYGTPRGTLPYPPDAVLMVAGPAVLTWRAIAELRNGRSGASLLFLFWLGTTYAVITPNLGFDSSHYYAPLVTLNAITSGVFVGAATIEIAQLAGRARRGRQSIRHQKVQTPTT